MVTRGRARAPQFLWSHVGEQGRPSSYGHAWPSSGAPVLMVTRGRAAAPQFLWSHVAEQRRPSSYGHAWASKGAPVLMVTRERARAPQFLWSHVGEQERPSSYGHAWATEVDVLQQIFITNYDGPANNCRNNIWRAVQMLPLSVQYIKINNVGPYVCCTLLYSLVMPCINTFHVISGAVVHTICPWYQCAMHCDTLYVGTFARAD